MLQGRWVESFIPNGWICPICDTVNQKYYRYVVAEPTPEDILLESLCIPTQTEVRHRLGSKLADVFFENLSSEGRIILGLQPPLTGPDDVWINPSSRLKNKVRCKPIPEPVIVHHKAFTHQAILELGEQYIQSLNLKLRQEIEESLKRQAGELEEECNKRLIEALEQAKLEADEQCKEVVGTLMEHFDRCFSEMVEKSKLRMRKECQIRVREERAELASYMLSQLQEEVEKRDLELCSDFHDTLYGELNALATKYEKQIESERKIAQEVLEEIIRKYETQLASLRSEMEVSSLADICRAISEEKARHERESRESQAEIKRQIGLLMKWVLDLKEKNKTLMGMATERADRIKKYQKKMKALIEEFQKFVNFALKAAPAHSEFLLSMQKMVLKTYHEDTILLPEDYEAFKNCLTGKTDRESEETDVTDLARAGMRVCIQSTTRQEEEEKVQEQTDELDKCRREKDSKYAFNYYRFKYILLKNLIKGVKFPSGVKRVTQEEKPRVERTRKPPVEVKPEQVPEEESLREYREGLTLVGEKAKEHMQPVRTFLQERMTALYELCKDDPDVGRMMLGCPPVERAGCNGSQSSPADKT